MTDDQGEQKTSKLQAMGWTQKAFLIIGLLLIATVVLFGMPTDLQSFLWKAIQLGVGITLIVIIIRAVLISLKPQPFSPTKDFMSKIQTIARNIKPREVFDLWIRGEDMMMRSRYGTIDGIGFIPYIDEVEEVKDDSGKVIDLKVKYKEDADGKLDGDTVFIIKRGFLNSTTEFIRCNRSLHSALVGDVYIKDVNLVPVGNWFYPVQQWKDRVRLVKQHEAETMLTTMMKNLDLIAQVTDKSLGIDPTFQKMMVAKSEDIGGGGEPGGQA